MEIVVNWGLVGQLFPNIFAVLSKKYVTFGYFSQINAFPMAGDVAWQIKQVLAKILPTV